MEKTVPGRPIRCVTGYAVPGRAEPGGGSGTLPALAMKLSKEHHALVHDAVAKHLGRSPGFRALAAPEQASIAKNTVAIVEEMVAPGAGDAPEGQLAVLAAVDFPTFVADLVGGTFHAVVNASIEQMRAYAELVKSASKSVDSFADKAGGAGRDRGLGLRYGLAARIRRDLVRVGGGSKIDIDLPDLDAGGESDIVPDNVRAVAAIYFVAQLEELKFFAVVDKVVEAFVTGQLPISGVDGDPLYRFHRDAAERLTEAERRDAYALAIGAGTSPRSPPNTAFDGLFRAFVTAVHDLLPHLPNSPRPPPLVAAAGKAGQALAVNASGHGGGFVHHAAIELVALVATCLKLLQLPSVLAGYGVRDHWLLVERVSALYLGGARNGVALRTLASSGSMILRWLADHAGALRSPETLPLAEIAGHVERWLAVAGSESVAGAPP
jgi:hypothetical protein